jgi:hypothetical protein
MLLGLLVTSLAGLATAALGPQPLYVTLSPQTLNLGGFLIQPYTEITQITAGGNYSCGQFVTYDDGGGVYTAHQYSGGSTANGCGASPRSFDLGVVCGATTALTGVFESPACTWHGVLETPAACGVSMVVGQELASVSATPSNSPTASATRTPAFFFTAFPTMTPSAAATPSGTPLFMVTAWPTPSPVNASPSSTPLFFMTAYPTPGYGNGSALGASASSGGSTATILGAVAVGGMCLAAVGVAIMHFKKGGTVKDLFAKLKANKGQLQALTKDLPLPDSIKKAIADPDALLPESAKKALATAASFNTEEMMEKLGVPDSVKSMVPKVSVKELATKFAENPDEVLAAVRDPTALKARAAEALKKKASLVVDQIPIPKELQGMAKSMIESSAAAAADVDAESVTLESVVEIKPDERASPTLATAAVDAAAPSHPDAGNTIEHMYKSTRTAPE